MIAQAEKTMSSETRVAETQDVVGAMITIAAAGVDLPAFHTVHVSGSGPGLLLISDSASIDAPVTPFRALMILRPTVALLPLILPVPCFLSHGGKGGR